MSDFLRKAIIAVVIFIVLVVGYRMYSNKQTSTEELVRSSGLDSLESVDGFMIEDTFVDVLININTISLDTSLWSKPEFASLEDFSVVLVPETVGRDNPFVPTTKSVAEVEIEASGQ